MLLALLLLQFEMPKLTPTIGGIGLAVLILIFVIIGIWARVFVVWPRNVRVGENSPSLWSTMFSVM